MSVYSSYKYLILLNAKKLFKSLGSFSKISPILEITAKFRLGLYDLSSVKYV